MNACSIVGIVAAVGFALALNTHDAPTAHAAQVSQTSVSQSSFDPEFEEILMADVQRLVDAKVCPDFGIPDWVRASIKECNFVPPYARN